MRAFIAGATIFSRWTAETKQLIRKSRVLTTRYLVVAIDDGGKATLFSTSAVGYHGFRGYRLPAYIPREFRRRGRGGRRDAPAFAHAVSETGPDDVSPPRKSAIVAALSAARSPRAA